MKEIIVLIMWIVIIALFMFWEKITRNNYIEIKIPYGANIKIKGTEKFVEKILEELDCYLNKGKK